MTYLLAVLIVVTREVEGWVIDLAEQVAEQTGLAAFHRRVMLLKGEIEEWRAS